VYNSLDVNEYLVKAKVQRAPLCAYDTVGEDTPRDEGVIATLIILTLIFRITVIAIAIIIVMIERRLV